MRNIWLISDTHFDHANILKFTDSEGKRFRGDLFSSVEEMNEVMIQRWNDRIKPEDHVYHLGDVTFKPNDFARIACRLNGHKRLLGGNHDDLKNYNLTQWFEKIGVWRVFKEHGFICSHVPITKESFRYKVRANVHGHIHQNDSEAPWLNVCVEKTDYYPVHIDEIAERVKHWPDPLTYKDVWDTKVI